MPRCAPPSQGELSRALWVEAQKVILGRTASTALKEGRRRFGSKRYARHLIAVVGMPLVADVIEPSDVCGRSRSISKNARQGLATSG